MGGVSAIALLFLGACNNKEPNVDPEPEPEYDDTYYASLASVSSADAYFTSTEDGGSIYFKTEGGEVTVNVDCGTEWTVENHASDLFTTTIANSTTLTVSAGQNTVEQEQTGAVTLMTAAQRIEFATITIAQGAYGAPEITVETNEWKAPAAGALSTEIAVDATADWTAEAADEWLSVEKTDTGVSLTAEENEDTAERETKVTLTCTDGIRTVYEYVNVSQDAKVYLTLSAENVSLAKTDDASTVTVESNYDWDFSYDTDNGWYTVSRDGDSLTITSTADNETDEDFESIITLTAGDGAENVVEAQISVVEENNAEALILIYTTTSDGTTITLPLAETVDCSVNWGDGSSETVTDAAPTHTYETAGEYEVVVNGTVTGLSSKSFASSSKTPVLTAVKQWGKTGLTTMANAFYYCKKLTSIPDDTFGAFADVTTFGSAFYYCSGLTSIPEGLFDHASKATTFSSTFYYCSTLPSIPAALFAKCTEATDFTSTFHYCKGVTEIGAGQFDNCKKATTFDTTCGYVTSLTAIPEGLFANNTEATTFYSVFRNCTALVTVPENLFLNCSKVTTFSYVFYSCSSLPSVPENVFSGCTAVTDFSSAFYGCSSLTSAPGGLFSDCTGVTDFQSAFSGCKALKEIGTGLFANNVSVTSFYKTFLDCAALTAIPDGLFDNCTNTKTASYIFSGCSSLTVIPNGLFANFAIATTFASVFTNCTGITVIPENLFTGCIASEKFTSSFSGCTSLTSVPGNLFADCSATTDFQAVFSGCTALEEIGTDLFAKNTAVTTFYQSFQKCSSLKAIPENLFANCKVVTDFRNTFDGCTSLTGESAYDVIESSEKVSVIHIYERSDYTDAGYTAPTKYSSCYSSCTELNDYNSIPKEWGGTHSSVDLSSVLGTYTAKGYAYSEDGEAVETTWTLKIYESYESGYDIFIDGLVPLCASQYPDTDAYIAQATYTDGKIVIPAQLTGYKDASTGYYIGWYPCSRYDNGSWYRNGSFTRCTFTYDSGTDTWTSDYGEFLAVFSYASASSTYFYGLYDATIPGVVLTRTSTETSVSSNGKTQQSGKDPVVHTRSARCE